MLILTNFELKLNILVLFFVVALVFFWDRISLYIPDYPGSGSVNQAGLDPPVSASPVLGLKARATAASLKFTTFYLWMQTQNSILHYLWFYH